MDTKNKSYAEIQQMIAELQAQADAKIESEKKTVIAEIKRLAASVNLTVEINDNDKPSRKSKNQSSVVSPKYRNPDNFAETWSGRGPKPKWLKRKLEMGAKQDDFLI